jgi:hypothetical protein
VLRDIFEKVCVDFDVVLRVDLSRLVNSLEGVSSRMLRKQRPDIVRR